PPSTYTLSLHDALPIYVEGALRGLPAEHLVEHHTEAVDIGAMIDGLTALLLGSHVVRRADDETGDGGPRFVLDGAGGVAHACQADRKSTRLNSSHSQIS